MGREVRAEYVDGEFIFLEVSLWPSELMRSLNEKAIEEQM